MSGIQAMLSLLRLLAAPAPRYPAAWQEVPAFISSAPKPRLTRWRFHNISPSARERKAWRGGRIWVQFIHHPGTRGGITPTRPGVASGQFESGLSPPEVSVVSRPVRHGRGSLAQEAKERLTGAVDSTQKLEGLPGEKETSSLAPGPSGDAGPGRGGGGQGGTTAKGVIVMSGAF